MKKKIKTLKCINFYGLFLAMFPFSFLKLKYLCIYLVFSFPPNLHSDFTKICQLYCFKKQNKTAFSTGNKSKNRWIGLIQRWRRRRRWQQRMRCLDGITDSMDISGSWCWTGRPGMLLSMELQRVGHNLVTGQQQCFKTKWI